MLNFWGPKKDKKVINSSTKCLISVKIAIMTPHIIPLPLVNVWLIFDLQKYVSWLCVFSKVNPCFQKAQVFCMDLQPAADPYNVVCTVRSQICLQYWFTFFFFEYRHFSRIGYYDLRSNLWPRIQQSRVFQLSTICWQLWANGKKRLFWMFMVLLRY